MISIIEDSINMNPYHLIKLFYEETQESNFDVLKDEVILSELLQPKYLIVILRYV